MSLTTPQAPPPPRTPNLSAPTQEIQALKVLITEESELTRTMLRRVLSTLGVGRVHCCPHSSKIPEMCAQSSYDILLVEYNPPYQNIRSQLNLMPRQPAAIIGLLSTNAPQDIEGLRDQGIHYLLTKPLAWAETEAYLHPIIENAALHGKVRKLKQKAQAQIEEKDARLHAASQLLKKIEDRIHKQLEKQSPNPHADITRAVTEMMHEMRTPLNAIIGFSEIIHQETLGPVHHRYKSYAQDILDAGNHLKNIIDDLLQTASVGAGAISLHVEEAEVTSIAKQALRLVEQQAQKNKIILKSNIATNLPKINTDIRRLRQVLLDLLSNAVKYTLANGCITLTASMNAESLEIIVSDTGMGIDEKDIPLVMSPYGRVTMGRSASRESTGLGLPMSKKMTALLGGQFELRSKINEGTTITLTFPPELLRQHNT